MSKSYKGVHSQVTNPIDTHSHTSNSAPNASVTMAPNRGDMPENNHYGARPECFKSTAQEIGFVLTCTMAIGISAMTSGLVTVISSFVGVSLGMTTAEITWLSAATSLAGGSFLLFFARVADLFGRRTMFIGSLFLFSILALGAGFCQKPIQLDLVCGFIGLMSASAVPPAQGMLGRIYSVPSRRKNAAFACFGAGNPLGFVFGMISAGIATQLFSWRASFWFMAILYLAFTILAIFTIPKLEEEKAALNSTTLKSFDVLGVFLTIAGTSLFSAALSLGSDAPEGWRTGYVIALLVVGVILMFVFVAWELWCDQPLIEMSIFKDRNFSLLLIILLLGFLAFPSASFWISLYIQRILHKSAIMTAVYLLPMAIFGTIVNVIAGAVLHRVSNKVLMGIAAASYTISNLFYALNRPSYPYWAMLFLGQIFAVIGADLQFNVVNMYVMSSLKPEQQSLAGGLFQMVTRLCLTVGMGVSTAIYDSVANSDGGDAVKPYASTFWFAVATSGLSILFVPFLTIRTQGHVQTAEKDEETAYESPSDVKSVNGSLDEKQDYITE